MTTAEPSNSFAPRPALNDAQQHILDRLGAPASERPVFEAGLKNTLRLELEKGFSRLLEDLGEENLYLSKHKLDRALGCEGRFLAEEELDFEWSPAIARGVVAHKAIEIAVTSNKVWTPLDLVDEAIARLQNEGRGAGEWLQTAPDADRDAVRAEANNRVCMFQDCWPPLDRRWRPATEVQMRADFFEGRIVLAGKPDLTIGQSNGQVAGKVIVDFKTGRVSPAHVADLRYYALLETLRVGVPPRLLVSYYLEAGELVAEQVTIDLLMATVNRTIGAAQRIVELRSGARQPTLAPSGGCRWCPALPECATGASFLDDQNSRIDDPAGDED